MHRMTLVVRPVVLALSLLLAPVAVRAEVKLAGVFADHMVLQRDVPVPVWGSAAPGEKIALSIADSKAEATAGEDGKWMARLPALKAGGPFELIVAGKNTVTLTDVLVGEVWVCGGQSNMELKLERAAGAPEAIAAAKDPLLRQFRVKGNIPSQPAKDVRGEWQTASPETVKAWSATGYFFGRELRDKLNVPVALIHNAVSWTPAEAWTSRETLEADPALKPIVQRWDQWTAAYAPAYQLYQQKLKDWHVEADKAKAEGKAVPAEPVAPANPQHIHHAIALYNGMVAPLMPYAIRGVIWYQGETNAPRADQYRKLFPAMIRDWRSHWGQGDFPFLYVQIAPLDAGPLDRAELRDAQRETLSVPNTAMIVTLDIGDRKNEHPTNKKEVGRRLWLAAQKLAYSQNVEWSGPLYKSMRLDGRSICLSFDSVGKGLAAKGDAGLKGFTIAGEDKHFVPAEARIEGETVVVSSAKVEKPVAVRYAFANWPGEENVTLFNAAGLPASSFRTDDWPLSTMGETKMLFDQMGLDEVTLTPKPKGMTKPAGK